VGRREAPKAETAEEAVPAARDRRGDRRRPRGALAERVAHVATEFTGSTTALLTAVAIVLAWGLSGPLFGFSATWQLVINTGTTIVTFLMVFLIQRAQNKESLAVQLKLNELVAAVQGASNRLVNVEDLTEDELRTLHEHYAALARLAKEETDLRASHSVDEAAGRHRSKLRSRSGGERQADARAAQS
jgi:low affinity Fe/Cu permease